MSATVAHASGSERCVCFVSVFFRVNPWQMLLLILFSVSLLLSFQCFSVFVRG